MDKLTHNLLIAERLAAGNSPKASLLYRKARQEIEALRRAVVKCGDKSRMASVEPMELQQAIDRAFLFDAVDTKEPKA